MVQYTNIGGIGGGGGSYKNWDLGTHNQHLN